MAPAAPAMPGSTVRRPAVPVRPSVPPGMQLSYDPTGREWRQPPRSAGVVAEVGAGAEAATSRVEAAPQARAGKSELPRTAWLITAELMRLSACLAVPLSCIAVCV